MVSSGSTPPLNSASRIASCSACIVRSSSSMAYGLPNPLDSSRSDSLDTRSSRSRSSRASPVNFVYRYFMRSVVVLLLPARNPNLLVHRLLFTSRRPPLRLFDGGVAALFGAADLLLRVEAFEHEVDRGRDRRCGRALRQPGTLRQLANALQALGERDDVFRGRAVFERQRSAEVEPFHHRARVDPLEHAHEDRADRG